MPGLETDSHGDGAEQVVELAQCGRRYVVARVVEQHLPQAFAYADEEGQIGIGDDRGAGGHQAEPLETLARGGRDELVGAELWLRRVDEVPDQQNRRRWLNIHDTTVLC